MKSRHILTHSLALAALTLPILALAHGGVEDGHVEDVVAVQPAAGASALLLPWTTAWFGLLAVSTLITSLISYGVYRYVQVPPVDMNKQKDEPQK